MTKQEILSLLKHAEDDEEIYMMDKGRVVRICLVESSRMEVMFGELNEKVFVMHPCHCDEDEKLMDGLQEVDIDINLN